MIQLIKEAVEMLLDRDPLERALIVYIASMNDEERRAIVMAHKIIEHGEENEQE